MFSTPGVGAREERVHMVQGKDVQRRREERWGKREEEEERERDSSILRVNGSGCGSPTSHTKSTVSAAKPAPSQRPIQTAKAVASPQQTPMVSTGTKREPPPPHCRRPSTPSSLRRCPSAPGPASGFPCPGSVAVGRNSRGTGRAQAESFGPHRTRTWTACSLGPA